MFKIIKLLLTVSLLLCSTITATQAAEKGTQQNPYVVAITADDFVARILFDAIATEFDLSVRYQRFNSFDQVLNSVQRGGSDFAPNVTYTPERARRLQFSSPTNIEHTYLFSDQAISLTSARRIAVPTGTIFGELTKQHYPDVEIVTYHSFEQAFRLLNDNQVDGIVAAINSLVPMLENGLKAYLLNNQLSIKPVSIISKPGKHTRLLQQFVSYMHSEAFQRQLHQAIAQRQFQLRQQALRKEFSRSGIDRSEPLKVKLEPLYPYVIYHDDGSISGISYDILMASCSVLELQCEVVSSADESWQSMLDDLISKRIDLLTPIVESAARQQITHFAEPHFQTQAMLVKRFGYKERVYHNVSELISERIGVVKGDFYDNLLSRLLPQKMLFRFANREMALAALLNSDVDYVPLNTMVFNQVLQQQPQLPLEQDRSIGVIHYADISFGFKLSNQGQLLSQYFDSAAQILDTQSIINRYQFEPNWRMLFEAERRYDNHISVLLGTLVIGAILSLLYLNRLVHTDHLTKLGNRRALASRLRRGVPAGTQVLYLDINGFKQLNDSLGHDFGDHVLQSYASHIQRHWRGKAYRIGGDEFVLLGKLNPEQLASATSKLRQMVLHSVQDNQDLTISVAIGLASDQQQRDYQTLLRRADEAMYRDKCRNSQAA